MKEGTLLAAIDKLNKDPEVDGFIVQLPLPKHLNEEKITLAIDPDKDIDGFHPVNIGRMTLGLDAYLPATPQGIITLLERYQIETSGKHAVVIGRSNIVGKPMSILLSRNDYPGNCTVTMCHSRTTNLEELCHQADIIVAALGRPVFVKADMIKPGAVVIDVGMNSLVKVQGSALASGAGYWTFVPQQSPFLLKFDAQRRPYIAVNIIATKERG